MDLVDATEKDAIPAPSAINESYQNKRIDHLERRIYRLEQLFFNHIHTHEGKIVVTAEAVHNTDVPY